MTPLQRITILGAGFGALSTVRALRRQGWRDPITLVAPRAELHYLPGSIWIPGGLRTRADLVVPLAPFFARMGVQHVAAEVTGLSPHGCTVHTSAGDVALLVTTAQPGGRMRAAAKLGVTERTVRRRRDSTLRQLRGSARRFWQEQVAA